EITSISPQFGPAAGGTQVHINGLGFRPGMDVKFGDTRATIVSVNVGGTQITVNSPPGTGIVDVTVTNAGGTSAITSHDQFTYVSAIPSVTSIAPASGPAGGGTSVVIQGTAFTGALSVAFGGSNAASFKLDSDTQITATAPAGAGTVHVRVTTPGGVSGVSADDEFTYLPAPAVTAISPTSGPAGGGTQVTITGTALTGATDVRFGSTPASGFSVNSDTHITAHTPPGSGTVHVTVSTPDGTSATSSADQFTYVPAPMVTSVVPNSGPVTGKTTIVITGRAFTGATAVSLTVPGNSTPVASFTVDSDTQITAVTPATGAPGAVDVRVTTPSGTSPQSASDVFTYSAATTGGPAGRAYVANSGDNTISVIDTSTNKVLRTMAVPAAADQPGVAPAPDALALDSAGTHLFVAGRGNNTIYAMDAATGNVASTFNTLASGGACGPMGLALSLDGSRLYVEGSTCTTATVLDAGNPSHLALVANIATVAEGGKVAVSSSSGRAYFGDNGAVISGGGLQSVNTATNTVVGPVDHTGAVFGVSVTHVPQDFSCPQPVLWYASAQTVVQTLIGLGCGSGTTGASFGTALRGVSSVRGPSTLMAAVADQANTLWIVTPSGDVGIAGNPVSVGNEPLGTALANDLSRAYVTNSTDGTVSVVDPSALTVVTTISVGPSPTDILFSPNIPPGG
ncbi:MAG: IPT/TIG domain-containing protein, partial [Frankiaceae bacterium]|nr:IPT/TIG domain-containing protein [Frankiaceae bacterium]